MLRAHVAELSLNSHSVSGSRMRALLVVLLTLLACAFVMPSTADALESGMFSFRQQLPMPIDTSLPESAYQPIDLRITFSHPCWAPSENQHSVRVVYGKNLNALVELESQIYDLESANDQHITACSLVFLVPPDMDGRENYYVLYDEREIPGPDYPDHVKVEEASYFYEPISGQKIAFDYYKIMQGEDVVYGVIQKGELLGNGISHSVVKMLPGSPVYETSYADQMASFSMYYSIDGSQQRTGPGYARQISKGVLVDGNLMVRVRLAGTAPEETVRSDNIYTYYYNPTTNKRMSVNVHHTVLKSVEIGGSMEEEGMYAGILSFRVRSQSFQKLNTGVILPYLHMMDEDNIVRGYQMPQNPTSSRHEWVLTYKDDADLGSRAWLCLDDPATGKAHALVFQSSTGLLEGPQDGLQVKASGQQYVNVPGLEADAGQVIVNRNAYQMGGTHDTVLPAGLEVRTNIEFFSSEDGGYEAVDREATMFQQLAPLRPFERGAVEIDETPSYNLTVTTHLSPSFPLGAPLSALLGRNVSYITVELYRNGTYLSSGSASRIKLYETPNLDLSNLSLMQTVALLAGLLDLANTSVFKSIVFPDVPAGSYLVKVYREHPMLKGEREYIGFSALEFSTDASVRIVARPQGQQRFLFQDQHGEGVPNVHAQLLVDGVVVAEETSNQTGVAVVRAPLFAYSPYSLRVSYSGFVVQEDEAHLSLRARRPTVLTLPQHTLSLILTDTWGLPPAVDTQPVLTSPQMALPTTLLPEKTNNGQYHFSGLYPATYTLSLRYKSFLVEETVDISRDTTLDIVIPAEFSVSVQALNAHARNVGSAAGTLTREGHTLDFLLCDEGRGNATVPPGLYEMKLTKDGRTIARQTVNVLEDKNLQIVTKQHSLLHQAVTYGGVAICLLAVAVAVRRRHFGLGFKGLAVGLLVLALVSPWWQLEGFQGNADTRTVTLLFPPVIVTLTDSPDFLGGEIAQLPAEFTLAIYLLSLVLVAAISLLVVSLVLGMWFKREYLLLDAPPLVLMVLVAVGFLYGMSLVAEVGIGSFMGSGAIESSAQGLTEGVSLQASWGAARGLYAVGAAVGLMGFYLLYRWRRVFSALFGRLTGRLTRIGHRLFCGWPAGRK